jgi:hypothetical protein
MSDACGAARLILRRTDLKLATLKLIATAKTLVPGRKLCASYEQ